MHMIYTTEWCINLRTPEVALCTVATGKSRYKEFSIFFKKQLFYSKSDMNRRVSMS